VVQLGLEDKAPFLESERHATLQQLLMARSGIYIRSGNDEQDKLSPKRGSSYPGLRWFYNKSDFDAAGIAFEKIAELALLRRQLRGPAIANGPQPRRRIPLCSRYALRRFSQRGRVQKVWRWKSANHYAIAILSESERRPG
jgi:hypothetical protein